MGWSIGNADVLSIGNADVFCDTPAQTQKSPLMRAQEVKMIGQPMKDRVVTRHGDFEIATAISNTAGFIAWGKMGRIVGVNPIDEPGEYVWCQYGRTRDEARDRLLDELGLPPMAHQRAAT
jgi:hypothetical protein